MKARLEGCPAPKVRAFLKQHALDIDQERLKCLLPRLNRIISKQKPKPGLEFKVLLQQLDREIDWRFAAELESMFLSQLND